MTLFTMTANHGCMIFDSALSPGQSDQVRHDFSHQGQRQGQDDTFGVACFYLGTMIGGNTVCGVSEEVTCSAGGTTL